MVKTNQKLTIYNETDFATLQELSNKVSKERAINLINELSKLDNSFNLFNPLLTYRHILIKL